VAELRIETGDGDPALVAITDKPILIGRSTDVDLQIADQRLSRHHCRLEVMGDKLIITDLGSSNGTFARGQRVTRVAIDSGEAFYVGKTRVVFNANPQARPEGPPVVARAGAQPVNPYAGVAATVVPGMTATPPPAALTPTPAPAAMAPPPGGPSRPPYAAPPEPTTRHLAPAAPVYAQAAPPAAPPAAPAGAPPSPRPAPALGQIGTPTPTPTPAPTGIPQTASVPRKDVLSQQAPAFPAGQAPPPRETLGNEPSPIEGYQIFDKLGEGSMGMVYTARSLETGEVCVLKTIKFDGSSKDAIFFIREAQMGMKLKHPNIVSVTDFGEAGGTLYLAMEYVNGGSLLDRIKKGGPISNRTALDHLIQLADALDYAGRKKFVHRDIKPANILLTPESVPKLADFGLAKMMAAQNQAALTKVGETRGTPIYMPPELLTNAADADARADIYSLGATYYHALAGFHPFRASSVIEILRMVVEQDPPPIEGRNPAAHPALCAVIRRMMAKKREDRFQTPTDLAKELQRIAPEIPE